MKLRIYFQPGLAVLLIGIGTLLLWLIAAAIGSGILAWIVSAIAAFYTLLLAISAWALLRVAMLERWRHWDKPGRLLILAPHEDDCVISAGGIALRNARLGGATRIVYMAPDENPGMAERRIAEAHAAWRVAGFADSDLQHLDLLPLLAQRNPQKLRRAAGVLRSIIDEFKPTVVVVPMFEGGHVQHDMTAALVGEIMTPDDRFEVFEAPEYSPYTSLMHTPHRVIALCARWLFGLVAYYGPPDGIDGRPIGKYRLDPADLDCKRRMLAAFVSQNAPSLVITKSYHDRFVLLDRRADRRMPFDFRWSYLRFVMLARGVLPPRIVDRLFPVQLGTHGRESRPTDWAEEWQAVDKP